MIGETIGSYVLERRLGEGGMGTVYAARHTGFGRRAAVKVLRPEHSQKPEILQRFFNEARAAAAIDHAGIVQVLDVGRADDGRAYLVMELLDGEPLSARLRGRTLDADTAVRITRQIADALAAAHARGIVHRDLKPDNVFLVRDPEVSAGERAKLLDFGIAKLHGELAEDQPVTQAGALFGTPIYMAPEQCRGAQLVDHRADLYALGCILYEMLCGKPPFMARGVGDLLAMQMFERPVPPRQHVPSIPESLEAITLQLLAKSPDERFASARALIAALGGDTAVSWQERPDADLATMLPVSGVAETAAATSTLGTAAGEAAPPTAVTPRARWPWIVGGAIVIAGATAALALSFAREDAVHHAAAVTVDAAALRAPELGQGFVDAFATTHGSALAPYHSTGAWDSAAHDFTVASQQAGALAAWKADADAAEGWSKMLAGDDLAALPLLESAAKAAPDTAWIQVGLASTRARLGDEPGAIDAAHEAQRLAPHWWQSFAAEARAHREAKEYDLAIEHYRRALTEAPDEPALLGELALVYHVSGLDDEAEELAKKALAGDPDLAGAHLVLAERAIEAHDGKSALAEADRVVAIDPRSATGQAARADALLLLGRKDDARAAFEQALAIEKATDQRSLSQERIDRIQRALDNHLAAAVPKKSERSDRISTPEDHGRSAQVDNSAGGNCDEVSCLLDNNEPTCCAKYRSSSTSNKAGSGDLPESLDRTQVSNAISAVKGQVAQCANGDKGVVKVKVSVGPDGRITDVEAVSPPDDALGKCVVEAVSKATFPHTQRGGSFSYPFSF